MSYLHRKVTTRVGRVGFLKSLFDRCSKGGAAARNPLSVSSRKRGGNGPAGVAVKDDGYHVVNVSDLTLVTPGASTATQAEAYALRDALVRDDPSRAGTIQVMASHELFLDGAA